MQNQNVPDMGGVFNVVNLAGYHYGGNNPVRHVDPDGKFTRANPNGLPLQYFRADGSTVERIGSSRARMNNNPGNIRAARNQIGTAGGFTVFPDYKTGLATIVSLLWTDYYINRTINDAISRYAPPSENDTGNYQTLLSQLTGLDNYHTIV